MKHFKLLSTFSVLLLLISCGPSGVEIRGEFYTSGADVPNVGTPVEGTQFLMFRNYNGQVQKKDYLKPKSEQHAKDMVKVENGMCHCDQWYYTTVFK
jgi:hypothetical protein